MSLRKMILSLALAGWAGTGMAATITTTSDSLSTEWFGLGQSFKPLGNGRLLDLSFFLGAMAPGRTYSFDIRTALANGTTLFSQTVQNAVGKVTFQPGINLQPGTTYFAVLNFNGSANKAMEWGQDTYAAGTLHLYFGSNTWMDYAPRDLRFEATFAEGPLPPSIPLPATGLLLVGAIGGLSLLRRR